MSAFASTYLAWRHTADGVALAIDDRHLPVPAPVTTRLLDESAAALTTDPAHDLLLLEQDLRWDAARLAGQLADAAAEVNTARSAVAAQRANTATSAMTGWVDRHLHQAAGGHLADANAEHATLTARHRDACQAIAAVRAFVAEAQVPDGWLAQAAAGWRRSPEPPVWVTVFQDEASFLDADARRSVPGWWGGSALGGEHVGYEWRRDHDDDDPLATDLQRTGPWWLAWLPATGEVYATRRSAYLPEQVWLLGTGFGDRELALTLLRGIEPHMREPNSLVLAAQQVHDSDIRQVVN